MFHEGVLLPGPSTRQLCPDLPEVGAHFPGLIGRQRDYPLVDTLHPFLSCAFGQIFGVIVDQQLRVLIAPRNPRRSGLRKSESGGEKCEQQNGTHHDFSIDDGRSREMQ